MTQAVATPVARQESRRSSTGQPSDPRRANTFLHALFFVLGFSVIFTFIFGPAAVLLGHTANRQFGELLQQIGALLLVIFAFSTLGLFRWLIDRINAQESLRTNPAAQGLVDVLSFFNNLLYTERRVTEMHKVKRNWGYLSSALMGMSFSAGWVPCIGPILASILFLASDSGTLWQGSLLLAIYSMGLGIPFLITGAAFGRATGFLRRLNRHANIISVISGIFLLVVAYLLWSGQLQRLVEIFSFLNSWVFALEGAISDRIGAVNAIDPNLISAAPIAFIAGIISFISPCVLPLVPAYIGYLSGATLNNASR